MEKSITSHVGLDVHKDSIDSPPRTSDATASAT